MKHASFAPLAAHRHLKTKIKQIVTTVARHSVLVFAAFAIVGLLSAYLVLAAISLSTSVPATQNFDGIGTTATATLPADFRADRPSTVRTVGTYAAAGTATTQVGGANLSTS